jgi:hypothetical protein
VRKRHKQRQQQEEQNLAHGRAEPGAAV